VERGDTAGAATAQPLTRKKKSRAATKKNMNRPISDELN